MTIYEIIQQMPPKEAELVYLGRVEALEDDLESEPILTIARSGFPFGTMVVTDRRMIILLQHGGGVQVIPFANVSSLNLIDGGRKMMGLGGARPPTLVVRYHGGRNQDAISIGWDGDWGNRAAAVLIEAHQRFAIRGF